MPGRATVVTCIDLKKRFPQYRITLDEACEDRKDSWMYQIPCRFGTIYPHGGDMLAVEVNYRRKVVPQLRALGLTEHQSGDGEYTFLFNPEQFKAVADLVGAKRKRKLSPEHRQKIAARFAEMRAKGRVKIPSE